MDGRGLERRSRAYVLRMRERRGPPSPCAPAHCLDQNSCSRAAGDGTHRQPGVLEAHAGPDLAINRTRLTTSSSPMGWSSVSRIIGGGGATGVPSVCTLPGVCTLRRVLMLDSGAPRPCGVAVRGVVGPSWAPRLNSSGGNSCCWSREACVNGAGCGLNSILHGPLLLLPCCVLVQGGREGAVVGARQKKPPWERWEAVSM